MRKNALKIPNTTTREVSKELQRNINKLGTFLDLQTVASGSDGFQPKQLTGITESTMYCGTHGSSFPWLTEDADVPSVNYMHQGKPKILHFCR